VHNKLNEVTQYNSTLVAYDHGNNSGSNASCGNGNIADDGIRTFAYDAFNRLTTVTPVSGDRTGRPRFYAADNTCSFVVTSKRCPMGHIFSFTYWYSRLRWHVMPKSSGNGRHRRGNRRYQRHRSFVGPVGSYDLVGAGQFALLTALGMREKHALLDIGCGSLRGGRFAIMYLKPGMYCGIEPERWLVEEGIDREIGRELVAMKRPMFKFDRAFNLNAFGRTFDYIIAQSIFSHASQEQIRCCLSEARKVMAPDAIFVATFVRGNDDYRGEKWVYPGLAKYTLKSFSKLVTNEGLTCQPLNWTHPHGQTWVSITQEGRRVPVPSLEDNVRIVVLEHQLKTVTNRLSKFTERLRRFEPRI
jgi:SAM-dependent methyltransferase